MVSLLTLAPFEDHMHGAMLLKKVDLEENKERGLLSKRTVFLKSHKYDYEGLNLKSLLNKLYDTFKSETRVICFKDYLLVY